MASVLRKTEIDPVDGTPNKRMFWSIVSDYDLRTGICELVDNALDLWVLGNRRRKLVISLELDVSRQTISVEDDAGGVRREDLPLLVSPGGSRNSPSSEIIGVFGVGSKRASIALGEHVEIRTRYKTGDSFQLDITREWLGADEWELAAYAIPDIKPNTTRVEISQLRRIFSEQEADDLFKHLGETYARFLGEKCQIILNKDPVEPVFFNAWGYPPAYPPRLCHLGVEVEGVGDLAVTITAGLIRDRDAEEENYGVYFYCNDRLIVKELRSRDVGYFVKGEAGVPHPDASLARVIVEMRGPARAMPWNSSKSGINTGHQAFQKIRPSIINFNSYYSSLSRRFKGDREGNVYQHKKGTIEEVDPSDIGTSNRMILPSLPKVNKSQLEKLKAKNKTIIDKEPWVLGLIEALGAVEFIKRQKLDTGNRIALILLDSNFEIALKEFIVHKPDLFPRKTFNDTYIAQLFSNRTDVVSAVTNKISIPTDLVDKAKHYYAMRNKLIHERATVGITDNDVANYKRTIEGILKILFKLRLSG